MSAQLLEAPFRLPTTGPGYGRRVNLRVVADGPEPSGPSDDAAAASARADRVQEAAELADLLRRVARGDADAFALLYDATSTRTYGVVWRVLRSADHAAEVTQEVYTEVWRQAARFEESKGSVTAWITTMAHRRAIDRVRSVTSEVARDEHYARAEPGREIDHVWEGVSERLDADRVRKGLESLTPIQREALTLAYFGGYTQSQVAERLKVPLGTVKTRIRDGLISLRNTLGVES
ncbi:sigma-70 family RNA polymerase sigma factor [Microlunatus spumicola]|uniref:Sigma-70 family RNA polymerase sigma factor n=1 Tax=Microlunatus spumicola TaxID=81499 RepID=A0ABP6YBL5_9ACTN